MNVLGLDSETHLFRPGCMAPRVVCLTWSYGGPGGPLSVRGEDRGIRVGHETIGAAVEVALDWAIAGEGENAIVGSFFAYDATVFLANFPHLAKKVFAAYAAGGILCTHVVEQLLDIAEGQLSNDRKRYSLAALAAKYLDRRLDKVTWRLGYADLDGVPLAQWPEGAVRYAVDDAVASRDVFLAQCTRAGEMAYGLPDAVEQSRASFALNLVSCWGLRTDGERVRAIEASTRAKMDVLRAKLIAAGLYKQYTKRDGTVVGSKSQKAMEALVSELYYGTPPWTATGRTSLAWETLDDVKGDSADVVTWMGFTELEKTASNYIEALKDGVVLPLHPRYNVLLETGRTSCSGPNIQNQPRLPGIRECFKPRDGCVYLSVDYDSQEMRCWAEACLELVGWSVLAERYQKDPSFDPHLAMAAKSVLRISEEEAKARLDARDKAVKLARQDSKIANFGLPGGMGIDGLIRFARGYGAHWTPEYAGEVRRQWQETWPEQGDYFGHVQAVEEQGYQIQLFSQRKRAKITYCSAANGYFQGLAADVSKEALFETVRRQYSVETSWLYGSRACAFVHDEIISEVPEEVAHEAAVEQVELMEAVMNHWTKRVPAKAAPALMRFWSKEAEAVYENGRLVPWEAH